MDIAAFKYKSPDFDRLLEYGFSTDGKSYFRSVRIMDGQFELRVNISADGGVKTEITDLGTGEPYTMHLIAGAGGSFVGAVRAEYEDVLNEIAEKCFKDDVFKSDCAHAVIEFVRRKYGDELEFLWKTFPRNAVWRRSDNDKWYGALLTVAKAKLGLEGEETVEVLDLRADPETLPDIIDGKRYFAGYHMNKKHWITVLLDGSVPPEEIFLRIDKSYELANKK